MRGASPPTPRASPADVAARLCFFRRPLMKSNSPPIQAEDHTGKMNCWKAKRKNLCCCVAGRDAATELLIVAAKTKRWETKLAGTRIAGQAVAGIGQNQVRGEPRIIRTMGRFITNNHS